MAVYQDILGRSKLIRDETSVGANTALRVGGVLVDLCEWMKSVSDNAGNGGDDEPVTNIDLTEYKWWGKSFPTDGEVIQGGIELSEVIFFTIANNQKLTKKLYLDDNGDLCFDGNFYATGGITALGSGGGTSGDSGVSLNSLLSSINAANPQPTAEGQVLTYNGSGYTWATPSGGGNTGDGTGVTLGTLLTHLNKYGSDIPSNVGQILSWNGETYVWVSPNQGTTSRSFFDKVGGKFLSNDSLGEGGFNGSEPRSINLIAGAGIAISGDYSDNNNNVTITATGGGDGDIDLSNYATKDWVTSQSYVGEQTLFNSLGYKLDKTTASDTYLSKTDASSTYATKASLDSYLTKTSASTLYAAKSHTHSTSDISGLASYIQGTKVSNATNADKATLLANARTFWGQRFDGSGNVSGAMSGVWNITMSGNITMSNNGTTYGDGSIELKTSTPFIDFHYNKSSLDYTARLIADDNNMLGFYTNSGYGTFHLHNNSLKIGNGTISWDSTNKCFKIDGSIYATGGITALGVTDSGVTNNNVDFTFNSVTANRYIVKDAIWLSESLYLDRQDPDFDLCSNDGDEHYFYLNGNVEEYYISSEGNAYFEDLDCDSLNFSGIRNFNIRINNASTGDFSIVFSYGGKTYTYTPSSNASVS